MKNDLVNQQQIQTDKQQLQQLLSVQEKSEIDQLLAHYPQPGGACIDALAIVQKYRGWVSDQAIAALAEHMGISLSELESVATFYNLIFRLPVGRVLMHPCNGISCQLLGYKKIQQQLQTALQIQEGETCADGQITLISLPCLGACDKAPVMLVREAMVDGLPGTSSESLLVNLHCSELELLLQQFKESAV
ncbi:MAG: NADH-quinone oxidoreductase subunit NuoE [Pseudomonadales bacterium]|nr:NADH-quinone oxidoreductase subunit NuoE [Pseudomonadales bacterium]NRA16526.1 NADH-quinone oxidoreductase subunit NuoE [Oceanospirillaceae bacterium]